MNEPREAGVGFAISTKFLRKCQSDPIGVSEKLMKFRLTVRKDDISSHFMSPCIGYSILSGKLIILGDFNARDAQTWNGNLGTILEKRKVMGCYFLNLVPGTIYVTPTQFFNKRQIISN